MIYPIVLSDELDLRRFIKEISKETVTQILLQTGQIKPMMKAAECYRILSRRKVDRAIREGKLKCVKKGVNILIKREDFEKFMNKHDFES